MLKTNRFRVFFTVVAAMFAFASFAGTLQDYPEIRDAVNNDRLTLYSYYACLDEGHSLQETEVLPIYYIVAPDGEHKEADVTIVTVKQRGPNTERVYIHVEIIDDGEGNLTCGTMMIEREAN